MGITLLIEQLLNGFQFGLILFLLSIGVTLIFGVMGFVNIAHGSMFMLGAFMGYSVAAEHGYLAGFLAGLAGAALTAWVVEIAIVRRLYQRSHLDQVLGTFGLMLIFNELVIIFWGRDPLQTYMPGWLSGAVHLFGDLHYPAYRIAISVVALAVGLGIYLLVSRSRLGMLIRAGSDKRDTAEMLGVNISRLFRSVFILGAILAALAGLVMAPLVTMESGVGEPLLILALVVVIVGGAGSMRGCFVASLLVGILDTLGRSYLPLLGEAGRALASMLVYWLMLAVLLLKPQGLFAR